MENTPCLRMAEVGYAQGAESEDSPGYVQAAGG